MPAPFCVAFFADFPGSSARGHRTHVPVDDYLLTSSLRSGAAPAAKIAPDDRIASPAFISRKALGRPFAYSNSGGTICPRLPSSPSASHPRHLAEAAAHPRPNQSLSPLHACGGLSGVPGHGRRVGASWPLLRAVLARKLQELFQRCLAELERLEFFPLSGQDEVKCGSVVQSLRAHVDARVVPTGLDVGKGLAFTLLRWILPYVAEAAMICPARKCYGRCSFWPDDS